MHGTMNAANCCPIVELRQYTLRPGQRDTLIELFDREFIEPQEALGMRIVGQFRDLDDPDRFVWLRGFADMPSRAPALGAFYGGPVWKEHRGIANATMVDSDNVLLLRPARPSSGFTLAPNAREATGAMRSFVVSISSFRDPVEEDVVAHFERSIAPAAAEAGCSIAGYFVTERSANDFPALPVREGENVFVWFATVPDTLARGVGASSFAGRDAYGAFADQLTAPPEVHRLEPTERSALR